MDLSKKTVIYHLLGRDLKNLHALYIEKVSILYIVPHGTAMVMP